ncbi:MAG: hypothetical protein NDJ75_11865, partial [Thermoanaerobaculia bacterium]|nr:hypothetical protein [Thermoanaerobaculia bacterium]
LSAERRAGYRWEGGAEVFPEIATVLRRLDAYERGGAPAVRELWAAAARTDLLPGLATAQARPARDEVEVAVATALREGRWAEGGRLSARTFVENCATLLDAQARRR